VRHEAVGEGLDPGERGPDRPVAQGKEKGDDPRHADQQEHRGRDDRVAGVLGVGLLHGCPVEAHEDHVGVALPLAAEARKRLFPGRKPAKDLEGACPVGPLDDPPLRMALDGKGRQIQARFVHLADHTGIAVREDPALRVGDGEVLHARLLGRLDEELLQLEAAPPHPLSGPRPRLEGADDGLALLQQKPRAHVPVTGDILQGEKGKQRDQERHGAEDHPGGHEGPQPFSLSGSHGRPFRTVLRICSSRRSWPEYFLIMCIHRLDT